MEKKSAKHLTIPDTVYWMCHFWRWKGSRQMLNDETLRSQVVTRTAGTSGQLNLCAVVCWPTLIVSRLRGRVCQVLWHKYSNHSPFRVPDVTCQNVELVRMHDGLLRADESAPTLNDKPCCRVCSKSWLFPPDCLFWHIQFRISLNCTWRSTSKVQFLQNSTLKHL